MKKSLRIDYWVDLMNLIERKELDEAFELFEEVIKKADSEAKRIIR